MDVRMPGTGYDRDAERIGLNLTPGDRRLVVIVFVVAVFAGMILASLFKS